VPSAAPDTLVAPAYRWVPDHRLTRGRDAVDLAALAGLVLDGEQALALDVMFAERADGKLATFESALICARQNMKTVTFQAAALADLFLFEARLVVWTAHLFDTAQEAFRDIVALIDGCAYLSREVRKVSRSRGEEGVELTSGARLNFLARSKTGGRGLSGDRVFLDEAFALSPAEMGSLLPTLSARPDPQVRYGSSAGLESSGILRGIRARGRAGGDPSLGYLEWCAPVGGCVSDPCTHLLGVAGCALDDPEMWRLANPAMGRRLDASRIAAERRALPPAEFARERLGWWEDPAAEGGATIPAEWWVACQDRSSRFAPDGQTSLGVHITPDRSTAYVAAVGLRADGLCHVEVVWEGSPSRAVKAIEALHGKRPSPVVLDAGSHAGSLVTDLEAAGIAPVQIKLGELSAAAGSLFDAVKDRTLRHIGQAQLDLAVFGATTRTTTRDAWSWKGPATAPLVAATLALHGYLSGPSASEGWVFFE
jgi:hypothetical protein